MTVKVSKPALNVRSELADLRKPTGIAGEAMLRAETPQEQFQLIGAGRRNIIINGDVQVSQRGAFSSATASSHGTYMVDRWETTTVGVNATVQKQTATLPNGWEATSTKITASTTASSGSYIGQNQTIEDGQRILRSGKTWTVSAWVKTNRNDVIVRLGGVKNVGEVVVGDGQWHYYSATFDYATSGSGHQGIGFLTYDNAATSVTTGDYIEFTQFQLELGKVATPFEHRSYGEELAACQRYYSKLQGPHHGHPVWSYTTLHWSTTFALPVTMRATPTITITGTPIATSGGQVADTKFAMYFAGAWKGLGAISADAAGSNTNYFRVNGVNTDTTTAGFTGGLYFGSGCSFNLSAEL